MYNRETVLNTIKEEKYKQLNILTTLISKVEFLIENYPNDQELGREIRKLLNTQ